MNIPITKPCFGAQELEALRGPLEAGWVVQGPEVEGFESSFADFTAARHALATSSCTTALHLCVAALGLRPGDEVIVPALTWISTANVVEYMGAKPVFCDVDPVTFNIATAEIEARLTPRTAGILPVHLFGLCADMDPILELAADRGLWVVEDAACAFGSYYSGRHAGTFGTAGCFSFHPRKSITTGEGGMVTTSDPELAALIRTLRDHGASRSDLSRHTEGAGFLLADYDHLGYNYRMTDLQGALGRAQLRRAEWILSERRRLAARYDELLAGLDWLRLPTTPEGRVHSYQAYVCLFAPQALTSGNVGELSERRNAVMSALEGEGIATRQGTHAAALQGYYRRKYGHRPEHYPVAAVVERLSLTLPLYCQMSAAEQERVCDRLSAAFTSCSSAAGS